MTEIGVNGVVSVFVSFVGVMTCTVLKRCASGLLWLVGWGAFVYLGAFYSFVHSIPPQGIEHSSYWHVFFLIPTVLTVLICTPFLTNTASGTMRRAFKGGATTFLISTGVSYAGCAVAPLGAEEQAWAGVPLLHVILFATLSGTVVGAVRPFGRSKQF